MGFVLKALLILSLSAAAILTAAEPAVAQSQTPDSFLASAQSSALLQQRVSEIAAARDIRPEVRQFAQMMARFRAEQLKRIQTLSGEVQASLPAELSFEQKKLVENLEPLDLLALARRYAELQVLALEQETGAYGRAPSGPMALQAYVGEYLPLLRAHREKAHSALKAANAE